MDIAGLNILSKPGRGNKPPVILVHGAWHGAWCWQGNFLEGFAGAGHDCHAPDLRGHGDSPAVKAMRWNSISDYANDVQRVVEACDRPPFLVGHSMGGYIVQHIMARDLPIAGACLLASAPAQGVLRTALHILRTQPLVFAKMNLKLSLFPLVADPATAYRLFVEPDADDAIKQMLGERLGDESYRAFLDMLGLNRPAKPRNPVPVLVIGGETDAIFSVKEQTDLAARFDAPCHILPNTPHNIMMSRQRDQAARLVLDWMGAAQ